MTNNSSHNERFEELCAAYVLNALDAEEQREFEDMLENANQEQLETFRHFRSTANHLAFTVERHEPSAEVKERLMAIIRDEAEDSDTQTAVSAVTKEDETTSQIGRYRMAVAAAIALLLVTLALAFYSFNQNATINDQEAHITRLETELEQKTEMLSILEARTVDMVVMSGLKVNPNGYGKVIWDSEKQQALLQVSNLPPVPAGKDYQLWLFKNNKPLPSGVFAVNDPSKDSFFKIEQTPEANRQNANAFAVTLEPEGGSQQPTGDIYLTGNMVKGNNGE